jgi:hypothetical protein
MVPCATVERAEAEVAGRDEGAHPQLGGESQGLPGLARGRVRAERLDAHRHFRLEPVAKRLIRALSGLSGERESPGG